jgi:hypothetical protein
MRRWCVSLSRRLQIHGVTRGGPTGMFRENVGPSLTHEPHPPMDHIGCANERFAGSREVARAVDCASPLHGPLWLDYYAETDKKTKG